MLIHQSVVGISEWLSGGLSYKYSGSQDTSFYSYSGNYNIWPGSGIRLDDLTTVGNNLGQPAPFSSSSMSLWRVVGTSQIFLQPYSSSGSLKDPASGSGWERAIYYEFGFGSGDSGLPAITGGHIVMRLTWSNLQGTLVVQFCPDVWSSSPTWTTMATISYPTASPYNINYPITWSAGKRPAIRVVLYSTNSSYSIDGLTVPVLKITSN